MYLIHAKLTRVDEQAHLPEDTGCLLLSQARPTERIEHVAVHSLADPHPVLGIYLLAESLEQAEANVARLCRRALVQCPELAGWGLMDAQAPLMAFLHE